MSGELRALRLRVERLRNVTSIETELSPRFTLIHGDNGQGKTTLLEAVYLLGAMRSFRGGRPLELVQQGAEQAVAAGDLASGDLPPSHLRVTLGASRRSIEVDGKRPEYAAHFFSFPMVAFHPGDLDLVFGAPSARRRFLDRMLFQAQAGYPTWYQRYRRALESRNELLRRKAPKAEICAFDPLLAQLGSQMTEARLRLVEQLRRAVERVIEGLGVPAVSIRLSHRVEPTALALGRALELTLAEDMRRGRTTVGPHGDDLVLERIGRPARLVASRGEARSLAVALRLGERLAISSCSGRMPLLLLDDIAAELDDERVERLLAMVSREPGQVIVTSTRADLPGTPGWSRREVAGGSLVGA